jgi:fructose-1,6-bisphosphatase II
MGIANPEKAMTLDEIVKTDDCFFVATGITDGMLLNGVKKNNQGDLLTHSLVISGGKMKSIQFVSGRFSTDSIY